MRNCKRSFKAEKIDLKVGERRVAKEAFAPIDFTIILLPVKI